MKSGRMEAGVGADSGHRAGLFTARETFLEEERAKSERYFRQEYLLRVRGERRGGVSQESIDAAFRISIRLRFERHWPQMNADDADKKNGVANGVGIGVLSEPCGCLSG